MTINFGKEKNKNSPKSAKMGSKNFYRAVKFLKRVGMQEFRSFLVFLLAGELFILLDVLSGDVFHCFIGKKNWHGNLKNDNPLGPGEGTNVENHWHGVNIENDEMEGHGERDGAHEQRVLRRWHDEERLVLRNRVQSIKHLNSDQNGKSHGHGVGIAKHGTGPLAVFHKSKFAGLDGTLHKVSEFPPAHLGTIRSIKEPPAKF